MRELRGNVHADASKEQCDIRAGELLIKHKLKQETLSLTRSV